MVHSSPGHMLKNFWPITTGDMRFIYQLEKRGLFYKPVKCGRVHMCVFYDEMGYFKLLLSPPPPPFCCFFLLSALKQLHSLVPWVASAKLNEAVLRRCRTASHSN